MPVGYVRANRLPCLIREKSIYHVRVAELSDVTAEKLQIVYHSGRVLLSDAITILYQPILICLQFYDTNDFYSDTVSCFVFTYRHSLLALYIISFHIHHSMPFLSTKINSDTYHLPSLQVIPNDFTRFSYQSTKCHVNFIPIFIFSISYLYLHYIKKYKKMLY